MKVRLYLAPEFRIMHSWKCRFLLILLAAVALAACGTNPVTGEKDIMVISEEKEVEIGRQYHQMIMQQYRVYEDRDLQSYVQAIGERLAANSHRPDLSYRFTLLDSEEINAFALPGGYIYITRGIMAYLNTEAELAAVLGHEIGHVTARHAARKHSRGLLGSIASMAATVATGSRAAGSLANLVGGALVQGYGRNLELEADGLGAEYLSRAGYQPEAMIDVVRQLKAQELFEIERAEEESRKPRVYHGLFSSHPDQDTRLREVIDAAAEVESAGTYEVDPATYLSVMDGVTFGKSKVAGFGGTGEVYHGGMGIALTFPRGWEVDQQSMRLQARSADGDAILVVTRRKLDQAMTPQEVMRHKLHLSDMREGRAIMPDGLPGYTAIAPKANSPFGERPVRYGVVINDGYAYVFAGASQTTGINIPGDWRYVGAMNSMRILEGMERRRVARQNLKIITADEKTTFANLAEMSPLGRYAEQELRLINGLYPDGEISPGQLLKTVQ
ncbi:MAG: M48 family metalloprotease [Gammaproteobacteria bacterium]|nr:M48 family metalloprotease [Gammaproteobacteria bacterium]